LFDDFIKFIIISCDSCRSSNNDFGYSFEAHASVFFSQLYDEFSILVELGFNLLKVGVNTQIQIIAPNIDFNSTITVNLKVIDFIEKFIGLLWISTVVNFLELGNSLSLSLNHCLWSSF
jgi:hypothetical protein